MSIRTRTLPAFEHMPCVRVVKNTFQTIQPNAGTPVIWDYIEHETVSTAPIWTTALPTRFTAPVSGVYYFTGNANFGPAFGGFRLFYAVQSGVDVRSIACISFGASGFYHAESISCDIFLGHGDYMEMFVYHNYTASGVPTAMSLDNVSVQSASLRLVRPATVLEPS